jgi:hypothetical protein
MDRRPAFANTWPLDSNSALRSSRCWGDIAEHALLDPDPANCAKSRAKIRRITQSEMYFAVDGQSGVRRPYPQAALPVQAGGA